MPTVTLDLLVRILALAAQLGRALGPDQATAFFRDLFTGLSPEKAAEKAAAALSITLDLLQLQADLAALQLAITTQQALASVDAAIAPLITDATEAGFARLEREHANSDEGSSGG